MQVPLPWCSFCCCFILTARCSEVGAQTPPRGFGRGPSEESGICSLAKYVKMIDAVNAKWLLLRVERIQGQV